MKQVLICIAAIFTCVAQLQAEVTCGWRQTRFIAAPEAVQAAAADEKYAYAITNTLIAKYDRRTGQRLAVSIGQAKHLNSGFFWRGSLYCAHSNFPLQPERSELKQLDVDTMKLTTLHDFGDFGGSLTWAVRNDNHWWCNFARYGKHNAGTFLAKFDDRWQEQGRWTYPAEVIERLGNYSLSGGIWHGEMLLVTGHDDPLVFQLRLPAEGHVLKFIQTCEIPFTGQGIADDSHTGGLVGINRAKRQIIFARVQ